MICLLLFDCFFRLLIWGMCPSMLENTDTDGWSWTPHGSTLCLRFHSRAAECFTFLFSRVAHCLAFSVTGADNGMFVHCKSRLLLGECPTTPGHHSVHCIQTVWQLPRKKHTSQTQPCLFFGVYQPAEALKQFVIKHVHEHMSNWTINKQNLCT